MFSIKTDLARLPKDLKQLNKNTRFAVAVGITWTGQAIKKHLQQTMTKVFDKPTRWTLNSLQLKPAKRDNWNGKVFFRDFAPKGTAAGKYLDAQIEGGTRSLKRSERHLKNKGFLDAGYYLVPGKDAKLNAFGNITKGQVTKALSDVGGQFNPEQNTKNKKKKFFWMDKKGRRLAGIYYRQGGALKSFMVAVRRPVYRRRLDFTGESQRVADKVLKPNIDKALDRFKPKK